MLNVQLSFITAMKLSIKKTKISQTIKISREELDPPHSPL